MLMFWIVLDRETHQPSIVLLAREAVAWRRLRRVTLIRPVDPQPADVCYYVMDQSRNTALRLPGGLGRCPFGPPGSRLSLDDRAADPPGLLRVVWFPSPGVAGETRVCRLSDVTREEVRANGVVENFGERGFCPEMFPHEWDNMRWDEQLYWCWGRDFPGFPASVNPWVWVCVVAC